jgi:patched 1 protein
MSLFRTWLTKLQAAYDSDLAKGLVNEEGWMEGASDDTILAYKLIVQTGHVDYPIDKGLLQHTRLVTDGIINPNAFYNYLSAWYSNDAMAYSYSQASLVPEPKEWFHDPKDYDLQIPKSKPIKYAQIPFLLNNLGDTEAMVTTIQEVRQICDRFSAKGLPNFPHGIPFTFWEQYLSLRFYLLLALAASLTAVTVVISVLFMSPWAGAIIFTVLASIVGQLFGALGILGIKLSAVPAVTLVLSVGMGVEFTVHILMSFVGCTGDRSRRVVLALEHMFAPVVHGAVSTLLGVLMLAFSQFDFIVRYFFLVLVALILLGLFNGLVFLPVLLMMVGPPSHVTPTGDLDCLPPCTPEPSPPRFKLKPHKTRLSNSSEKKETRNKENCHKPRRHNSEVSLSTIAEETHSQDSSSSMGSLDHPEPSSVHSSLNGGTSVFLEPHITVETTTIPANASSSGSSRSSSPTGQVTKVTATAKFKLELHTPLDSGARPSSRRSRRSSSGSSTQSSIDPQRASGEQSLASSLSSDGGFSEK